MKTKVIVIVAVGLALFSCSKKVAAPVVTPEVKVTETPALPVAIAEGKKIYENSCGRCHKLFPAAKHDKAGWSSTIERMAPKAKITEEQKKLVYDYITYGM